MTGAADVAQLAMRTLSAAATAAPILGEVAAAGCVAALVGAIVHRFARRASFASRANVMHALILVLLVFSAGRAAPPGVAAAAPAGDPPDATHWSAAPTIVVPRLVAHALTITSRVEILQAFGGLLVVVWLSVCALLLARLAVAAIALTRIRRRARHSSVAARHLHLLPALRRRARLPAVLVSDEIDIPFACGWRSPAIVVPAGSETWSSAEWRMVLLHERSHIARGDVAMQWTRQIVLALHWFNPAARWLIHRADEACEGACDDAVLVRGADAASYAGALIAFSRHGWMHADAPAATMTGRSGLERRVRAMIDTTRNRRDATSFDRLLPRAAGLAGGVALALCWPRIASGTVAPDVEETVGSAFAAPPSAVTIMAPTRSASMSRIHPIVQERIAPDDTTEALLGLGVALRDANPIVRDAAARALGSWRSATSLARLRAAASQGDPERRAAADAAMAAMEGSR